MEMLETLGWNALDSIPTGTELRIAYGGDVMAGDRHPAGVFVGMLRRVEWIDDEIVLVFELWPYVDKPTTVHVVANEIHTVEIFETKI